MGKHIRNSAFFLMVCLSFGSPDCWAFGSSPWQGTWEGVMGEGTHSFRVVFVLKGDKGEYHNIDDGIHGEPLTLETAPGGNLRARTQGGGTLVLKIKEGGDVLTGTFTQGAGKDSQQSLVGEGSYPVSLRRGEDFLHPRLMADGQEQTHYQYTPPGETPDGWLVGDLRKSRANLTQITGIIQTILQGKYPYIHSLVVVKDGRLVLEEYFYGYGPNDPHPVMSITKDIFSLLFGIGVGQGLVQPSQKLFNYFPDYRLKPGWDPVKDRVTLGFLLSMTSGLGCDDFKDSNSCSWKMFSTHDWLDFSLSLPLEHTPGSHFSYCGACLTPLGVILERQGGMDLPQYAQKFLFNPLGIRAPIWWEGPQGVHSPAFGLCLRPRDLAKIGLLVMKNGEWNWNPVVPKVWIEESTVPHVRAAKTGIKADYGYLWWERDVQSAGKKLRVLDAWGVGGQHVFVVPSQNLVCVTTGGNYKDSHLANNSYKILDEILDAMH